MNHFRVLYHLFVFRLMDVELLSGSARGDASVLLGQFGTILVFGSILFSMGALTVGQQLRDHLSPASVWPVERLLISLSMLVVGIFALLSWDATFIDRRDVFVLTPLPIRVGTLLMAKIAAAGSALGLALAAWNCLSGLAWPAVLTPPDLGVMGSVRFITAYLLTMAAAGTFLYCAVLTVQALALQLPRRWFLRASPFLQAVAFVLFLAVVFFQPSLDSVAALAAPENQRALSWLPSYWFLGMLSELSGVLAAESHAVMAPLAHRAALNAIIAMLAAGAGFYLSYLRGLRRIVVEPDSVPRRGARLQLPPIGTQPQTALTQFVLRTLLRSQRHRTILAFYLGGGFAVAAVYLGGVLQAINLTRADLVRKVNLYMLVATFVMLSMSWLGVRSVFAIPLDLRTNWIFRLTPTIGGASRLVAVRRALLAAAVAPIVLVSALALSLWPWARVAQHLLILVLVGIIVGDISLNGFEKIPFTCSYLPGKSKVHLVFWCVITPVVAAIHKAMEFELGVLASPVKYWVIAGSLAVAALGARRVTDQAASGSEPQVQFEDRANDELVGLGLGG